MSTAELKDLRKGVKQYIDHADERVVRMVYAMLAADQHIELSEEQEILLEQRMKKYEKGNMIFSSWEDAKARISSNGKNGL